MADDKVSISQIGFETVHWSGMHGGRGAPAKLRMNLGVFNGRENAGVLSIHLRRSYICPVEQMADRVAPA